MLAFSQSRNYSMDYTENTAQGAHNAFTLFFIVLICNFAFQVIALYKSAKNKRHKSEVVK